MDPLAVRVAAHIGRRGLLRAGDRVLVALSGGPDSVALTHLLLELADTLSVSLAGVAHFNHRLRAAAADDEAFCRALADGLGLRWVVGGTDVRALARREGRSVEDAGRRVRYEFLERACAEVGASHVAVAHTRDDQAETVLLRLLRGAGPIGLRSIHPIRGVFIRPLLDVSRAEIERFLKRRGLESRHDASNDDVALPRNRVRHELLPYLGRHFSPKIIAGLARHADHAHELGGWIDDIATQRAAGIVLEGDDTVEVNLEALAKEPLALRRVLLHRAVRVAARGRFVGAAHVEAVEAMVSGLAPPAADLPGQRAQVVRGRLVLRASSGSPSRRRGQGMAQLGARVGSVVGGAPVALGVPGRLDLPGGWRVEAEGAAGDGSWASQLYHCAAGEFVTVVPSAGAPLFVRGRRDGDRLTPVGLGGRKKLQDLFVDRKVARAERATWPLVVDAHDRIIWVVGLSQAADFQVREAERGVILLKAKRLGG